MLNLWGKSPEPGLFPPDDTETGIEVPAWREGLGVRGQGLGQGKGNSRPHPSPLTPHPSPGQDLRRLHLDDPSKQYLDGERAGRAGRIAVGAGVVIVLGLVTVAVVGVIVCAWLALAAWRAR
jgi:hypothetical protein